MVEWCQAYKTCCMVLPLGTFIDMILEPFLIYFIYCCYRGAYNVYGQFQLLFVIKIQLMVRFSFCASCCKM